MAKPKVGDIIKIHTAKEYKPAFFIITKIYEYKLYKHSLFDIKPLLLDNFEPWVMVPLILSDNVTLIPHTKLSRLLYV